MSANSLYAIVSDTLDQSIKDQLTPICASLLTQTEVEQAEDALHQKLLARIEQQKANGESMPLSPIKGRAIEIHGAKILQDGRVQMAIAVNLTVLFDIQGTRTDLETNQTFDAMYRYARGLLYVNPTHKDGTPNSLFNNALQYANDIAKNPKAEFSPNGSLDLRKSGRGAGLYQLVAQCMGDSGYIIFGVSQLEVQIGDGKSYQLGNVFLNETVFTPKTGVVNIIELDESLRFTKVVVNNTATPATPARQDMVIPNRESVVAPVAPATPNKPVTRPGLSLNPLT